MARIDDLEKGLVDAYGVPVKAELNESGQEVGDPTPVAPPAHLRRGMTTSEQIQMMIRREMSRRAEDEGYESFEESDDFEVDDDPADPHTPYEAVFDPPPPKPKESDNVDKGRDKGGTAPADSRSGKSGKVGKGQSGEKQPASDKGSPSETDDGDTGSEAED